MAALLTGKQIIIKGNRQLLSKWGKITHSVLFVGSAGTIAIKVLSISFDAIQKKRLESALSSAKDVLNIQVAEMKAVLENARLGDMTKQDREAFLTKFDQRVEKKLSEIEFKRKTVQEIKEALIASEDRQIKLDSLIGTPLEKLRYPTLALIFYSVFSKKQWVQRTGYGAMFTFGAGGQTMVWSRQAMNKLKVDFEFAQRSIEEETEDLQELNLLYTLYAHDENFSFE